MGETQRETFHITVINMHDTMQTSLETWRRILVLFEEAVIATQQNERGKKIDKCQHDTSCFGSFVFI